MGVKGRGTVGLSLGQWHIADVAGSRQEEQLI